MTYTASITTKANTTEENAKETKLKITDGVLTQVFVFFPDGCANLVRVQFFIGGHQFAPSTEPQTFKGDGILVVSPEFLLITDAPRTVTIKTWSTDTNYDHTIEVGITILPTVAAPQLGFFEGITKSLKNLFIREGKTGQ